MLRAAALLLYLSSQVTAAEVTEAKRIEIYQALYAASARAGAEAEGRIPTPDLSRGPMNKAEMGKVLAAQANLKERLADKRLAAVRAKYGISDDQAGAITMEGITKSWPFPAGVRYYVNLQGEAYHFDDCKYVKPGARSTSLDEARRARRPCTNCKPPQH